MRILLWADKSARVRVKKLRLIGLGNSLVQLLIAVQNQPVLDLRDRNYSGSVLDHGKALQFLVDPAFHVKHGAQLVRVAGAQ